MLPDSPVFAPSDGGSWMLARQVVQATDYTHSQMIEHLLKVRSRRFHCYCRNKYFGNITIIIIIIIIIIMLSSSSLLCLLYTPSLQQAVGPARIISLSELSKQFQTSS